MEQENPFGFKITVEKEKERVVFYMAGPDRRYNGKEYVLKKEEIDEFCASMVENFELYQLKKKEGNLKGIPGKMGMTIRFGLVEGVCFGGVYGQIHSEKKLKQCINYIRQIQECM
ncbi:MAG: hypothetical protein IJA32_12265 [Lachnospiraceae bacterium]|nr:hypothetical protein [Lachnospiraceae bacterium]